MKGVSSMKFNLSTIVDSAKGFYHKSVWTIQKNSPQICLFFGIATAVGAVIASSAATIKATPIIEEHNAQMAVIHQNAEAGKTGDGKPYTYADQKHDTMVVFTKTGIKLIPVFGLTLGLLGGSIISQICGYKIMAERLALAAAAYASLKNKYDRVCRALKDEKGAEAERAITTGVKAAEVVDENGETKNVKTIEVADDDAYTLVFGKYNRDGSRNTAWVDDMDANLTFLKMEQSYWNNILKARNGRPVTTNEIRARLCGQSECVESGQVVGWTYEPSSPTHKGDNYIDFGLEPLFTAYRNGEEIPGDMCIVLEFNADGNIISAFGRRNRLLAA